MVPDAAERQRRLVMLLDDATLRQPALTASLVALAGAAEKAQREDHWAITRRDRIVPGQVFNVAWTRD